MKDFYKRLKLSPEAPDELLRLALDRPLPGTQADMPHARAVLLTPHRRAQYDRVHSAVRHIAALRSQLRLEGTAFARRHEADFLVAPKSNKSSASGGTSRSARAASVPAQSSNKKWVAVSIFAVGVWALIVASPDSDDRPPVGRVPTEASRAVPPPVPVQPLPPTGAFDSASSSTQNSIIVKTRPGGVHTLVKIERMDGKEITRGFIRAGTQHKFDLPSGTYVLKTANGANWFGDAYLFGPETSYSRPDDTFPLVEPGEQWTVELIPQKGGNLTDRPISAAEF